MQMNLSEGQLCRDTVTDKVYQIISLARLCPGYTNVIVCRPLSGGEDIAVCPSRFGTFFQYIDDN